MATAEGLRKRFEDLARGAYLDTIVPKFNTFDPAAAVRDGSPEEIGRAPLRRNLFFVRAVLPLLKTGLEAHATDAVPTGLGNAASASGKHDLTSANVPVTDDVQIASAGEHTYVFWQPTLHLVRPRVRLQRPAIYFTATVSLDLASLEDVSSSEAGYLVPFEPSPRNVLEALNPRPELNGKQIYLSEDRITKVAPKPPRKEDVVRPVRGASKRAFPTLPALFTRMQFSVMRDHILASLHLETSQAIAGIVNPTATDSFIRVQCLTEASLPLEMYAGDETVLLYWVNNENLSDPTSLRTPLSIAIAASATLEQGSQVELDIRWQVEPHLPSTAPDLTYRWSSSLSAAEQLPVLPHTDLVAPPTLVIPESLPPPADAGIAVFFSAPATTFQYDDFRLSVKCINKTSKTRRFAVVSLQPDGTMRTHQHADLAHDVSFVEPEMDVPLTTSMLPDVFCHTPDVRIGPVAPGASAEGLVELRALSTGILNLGSFRIVDLDTQCPVVIHDLPDVVS
ncbi:hypothetical protein BAUCODRAFT_81883, partial [Baudoinia panamericana UAMH 10762]